LRLCCSGGLIQIKLKRRSVKFVSTFGSLLGIILMFQNCGKGFEAKTIPIAGILESGSTAPDAPLSFPELIVLTSVPADLNSKSLVIQLKANIDSRAQIQKMSCQLDQNPVQDCSSGQFSLSALTEGDHTVAINLEDNKSQKANEVKVLFKVDTLAPVVTVSQAPQAVSGNGNAAIEFTAVDATSGIKAIQCALDANAFADCTNPVNISGLADGTHTFKIRASDKAGNLSADSVISWTVNSQAPALVLAAKPAAISKSKTASFSFSGTAGGMALASYQCSFDGAAFAACTSPVNFTNLAEGNHNFSIRGTSTAGLQSAPLISNWLVDTVAPTTPVINSSVNNPTALVAATLSFTSTDTGSLIKEYQCSLDNSAFAICTSPRALAALTAGAHTFRVKAVDNATNESAIATSSWVIDNAAPTLAITAMPMNPTYDNSANFVFSAADGGSGLASLECSLDAGAYAACTSPKVYNNLSVSAHSFSVKATDRAGNQKVSSFTWSVEAYVLDGVALYGSKCASCHQSLANSDKLNRSATQIQAGIDTVPAMATLKTLTAAQVAAIAGALVKVAAVGPKYACVDPATQGKSESDIRRLSRDEMLNTLVDLFGSSIVNGLTNFSNYPVDDIRKSVSQFTTLHSYQHVQSFVETSLEVAQKVVANTTALNNLGVACVAQQIPSGTVTDACIQQFISTAGLKIHRRPLSAAESTRVFNIFKSSDPSLGTLTASDRVEMVIASLLQSQDFNFHLQVPADPNSTAARQKVDAYTVANRLSYRLAGTMPDATLLAEAAAGRLSTVAQVNAQALRLASSPTSRKLARSTFYHWMNLDKTNAPSTLSLGRLGLTGNAVVQDRLKNEYINEALDFAEYITFDMKGTFQDLLQSSLSFPRSAEMAKIMGVNAAVASGAAPVATPNHKGLFLRPALLATANDRESAVVRGVRFRLRMICDTLGAPPANADAVAANALAGLDLTQYTSRQISELTTGGPACIGCHKSINSPGYALAAFGPLGEFRTSEITYNSNNQAVKNLALNTFASDLALGASSETSSTHNDFINLLGGSAKVKSCLATYVFRFSRLRLETADDNCQLSTIESSIANNKSILDALVANVASEDIFWRVLKP
jgi:mono/diheme cytochrome c family protein